MSFASADFIFTSTKNSNTVGSIFRTALTPLTLKGNTKDNILVNEQTILVCFRFINNVFFTRWFFENLWWYGKSFLCEEASSMSRDIKFFKPLTKTPISFLRPKYWSEQTKYEKLCDIKWNYLLKTDIFSSSYLNFFGLTTSVLIKPNYSIGSILCVNCYCINDLLETLIVHKRNYYWKLIHSI